MNRTLSILRIAALMAIAAISGRATVPSKPYDGTWDDSCYWYVSVNTNVVNVDDNIMPVRDKEKRVICQTDAMFLREAIRTREVSCNSVWTVNPGVGRPTGLEYTNGVFQMGGAAVERSGIPTDETMRYMLSTYAPADNANIAFPAVVSSTFMTQGEFFSHITNVFGFGRVNTNCIGRVISLGAMEAAYSNVAQMAITVAPFPGTGAICSICPWTSSWVFDYENSGYSDSDGHDSGTVTNFLPYVDVQVVYYRGHDVSALKLDGDTWATLDFHQESDLGPISMFPEQAMVPAWCHNAKFRVFAQLGATRHKEKVTRYGESSDTEACDEYFGQIRSVVLELTDGSFTDLVGKSIQQGTIVSKVLEATGWTEPEDVSPRLEHYGTHDQDDLKIEFEDVFFLIKIGHTDISGVMR